MLGKILGHSVRHVSGHRRHSLEFLESVKPSKLAQSPGEITIDASRILFIFLLFVFQCFLCFKIPKVNCCHKIDLITSDTVMLELENPQRIAAEISPTIDLAAA